MEIPNIYIYAFPKFIQCSYCSRSDGHSIVNVAHNVHGFNLKMIRLFLIMYHDSSSFLQGSIIPLHHSILLRCDRCQEFTIDPFSIAKNRELRVFKLLVMVAYYLDNFTPLLLLDTKACIFEHFKSIRSLSNEINLCIS